MTEKGIFKGTKQAAALILFAVMAFWTQMIPAMAADETLTRTIAVVQTFNNRAKDSSIDETVQYEFKALDEEYPMPSDADGTKQTFSIKGSGQKELDITLTHAGVYEYKVYQTSTEQEGFTYDQNVYTVVLDVRNGANGLEATAYVRNPDGSKLASDDSSRTTVSFKDYYSEQRLKKVRSSTSAVVGLGSPVEWTMDYPMGPNLKKVVDGETVYATDMYLYDEMDKRLDFVPEATKITFFGADGKEVKTFTPKVRMDNQTTGDYDIYQVYDSSSHIVYWHFNDEATKRIADEDIRVTHIVIQTKVNASALQTTDEVTNNAVIEFVNAPGDPFTYPDKEDKYTAQVYQAGETDMTKIPHAALGRIQVNLFLNSGSGRKAIKGAVFGLAASEEDAKNGKYITDYGTVTTDENGHAEFTAVPPGDYWLVELETPDGVPDHEKITKVTVKEDEEENTIVVDIPVKETATTEYKNTDGKTRTVKTVEYVDTVRRNKTVKTGDETNLKVWFMLLGGSLLGLLVVILLWPRRRDDDA